MVVADDNGDERVVCCGRPLLFKRCAVRDLAFSGNHDRRNAGVVYLRL